MNAGMAGLLSSEQFSLTGKRPFLAQNRRASQVSEYLSRRAVRN
jgi:hypothetical protein